MLGRWRARRGRCVWTGTTTTRAPPPRSRAPPSSPPSALRAVMRHPPSPPRFPRLPRALPVSHVHRPVTESRVSRLKLINACARNAFNMWPSCVSSLRRARSPCTDTCVAWDGRTAPFWGKKMRRAVAAGTAGAGASLHGALRRGLQRAHCGCARVEDGGVQHAPHHHRDLTRAHVTAHPGPLLRWFPPPNTHTPPLPAASWGQGCTHRSAWFLRLHPGMEWSLVHVRAASTCCLQKF